MSPMLKTVALLAVSLSTQFAYADDLPAPKPAARDKVICKTETVVGSLIPGPKRCHTRAEWEEHARAGQAIARKLVEDGTGRPTTN